LTRCAQLEAASIVAFEILGAELERFGAPRHLVRAAWRAAGDELRHAQTMTALGGRSSTFMKRPKLAARARRSLRAVAIENAVEGCVRETYGALIAVWQGQTAEDLGVRRAMRRIGADEARHAQLAWNVQRWIDAKLPAAARQIAVRARRRAFAGLRNELHQAQPAPFARALGLPSKTQAIDLLNRLAQELAA